MKKKSKDLHRNIINLQRLDSMRKNNKGDADNA